MTEKTCPDCGRRLDGEAVRCSCGHHFREMGFGWTASPLKARIPRSLGPWLIIVGAAPIVFLLFWMLHGIGWFDLGSVSTKLVSIAVILLPLGAQLLPTARHRGGGCCLGCLTCLSMMVGLFFAVQTLDFEDPVKKADKPPLPVLGSEVCRIDGIELGESRAEIERRLGPLEPVFFPFVPGTDSRSFKTKNNTLITFLGESVVRVEGRTLVQDGKPIISTGQPRSRIGHLFDPSVGKIPRPIYIYNDIEYLFRMENGDIKTVAMRPLSKKFILRPTSVSVNGIALGAHKDQLKCGDPKDGLLICGEAKVTLNPQGRVIRVTGSTLEQDGEIVVTTNFNPGEVSLTHLEKFDRYGDALLRINYVGREARFTIQL